MKTIKIKAIAILLLIACIMQINAVTLAADRSQLQNKQSSLNSKIKETKEALNEI